MKKLLVNAVVTVSLAALLGACTGGGDPDPYTRVTLSELSHNMVISKGFKYKFTPEVEALHRHLGLVRDGNQLQFVTARSLEDKLTGLDLDNVEFAVVKRYSPYVHFKVERVVSGIDTVFPAQAGGITLPTITTPEVYGIDNFEEYDINNIAWNNTQVLRKIIDRKFKIQSKIVEEVIEGESVFYLIGERSKLRVGPTTDGVGLFLKALARNDYVFEGGIHMTEVENFADRRNNHVAGTVAVDYVMYGDRLITGG